ncbi:MAG: uracil-DNA glycosylase [Betaproteobacteria bacterium]
MPESERQLPLPIFDDVDDTPPRTGTPAPAGDAPGQQTLFGAVSREPEPTSSLEELEKKCRACTNCDLRAGCTQVVFGEGNPHAKLMFVGEGPGQQEDIQGRPFVGAAGQLLDKILEAVGIRRDEVYIANVVKCRPPGNRLPTSDEAEACLPHLRAQIEAIRPKIIVCLGALATQTLIDKRARITRARGNWFKKDGIMYMPTFHPAALLRDETKKRPVWEDMKKVRGMLDQLEAT